MVATRLESHNGTFGSIGSPGGRPSLMGKVLDVPGVAGHSLTGVSILLGAPGPSFYRRGRPSARSSRTCRAQSPIAGRRRRRSLGRNSESRAAGGFSRAIRCSWVKPLTLPRSPTVLLTNDTCEKA